MKKYLEILKTVNLFKKIDEKDLEKMLCCLDFAVKDYDKGSIIFLSNDIITQIGIVLSGSVHVIKEDYFGNRTILTELFSGEIFGEAFACADVGTEKERISVSVLATTNSKVLFIDYKKIVATCSSACIFHTRLIENMIKLLANKNLMLNRKIEILSKRSIREKLMSYFIMQMEKTKSNNFQIPFTRHELADFICTDRSAMSRELCRMRDDGLLKFHGNSFEIL